MWNNKQKLKKRKFEGQNSQNIEKDEFLDGCPIKNGDVQVFHVTASQLVSVFAKPKPNKRGVSWDPNAHALARPYGSADPWGRTDPRHTFF